MLYAGLINQLQGDAEKAFSDLEVATKNITNINTPGYKAERPLSFGEILDEEASQGVQKYMEAGKLNVTNRKNDVSMEGKGFFVLSDKNEETVLTRNLTLGTSKDGYLSSGDNLLFPKVKVPPGFTDLEVEVDGKILGMRPDGSKIKIAHLRVVNFPASEKLEYDGMVYRPTEEAGTAFQVCLGATSQTKVRQSTQESSNVDAPLEFARFNDYNKKVGTIARLVQLMNTSEREYIRTLTSTIG